MPTGLVIALREGLEVALLVGVVVRYLTQTSRAHLHKTVWGAVVTGLTLSTLLGYILFRVGGEVRGEGGEILELGAAIVSVFLIGTFLFWIKHQQSTGAITNAVDVKLLKREKLGLFGLILVSVLREGGETALFTFASTSGERGGVFMGIMIGALSAAVIGYALFVMLAKIPIKKLFFLTSIFLIIVAANMGAEVAEELIAKNELVEWGTWTVMVVAGGLLLLRDRKKEV